jgi:tRNA-specific 2-thiouridylase
MRVSRMVSSSDSNTLSPWPDEGPDIGPSCFGLAGPASSHRIVVAMSGGVDSSLAAALVKRAGYETIGITLQLYDHGAAVARPGSCCAGRDILDARRVASFLGIPHYVLNYEDRFRQSVIDEFAASYMAGETPLQPDGQVFRSVKNGARARRFGIGDGSLRPKPGWPRRLGDAAGG